MRRGVLVVAALGVLAFAAVGANFGALTAAVPGTTEATGVPEITNRSGTPTGSASPGETPTQAPRDLDTPECPSCGGTDSSGLLSLLPAGPWAALGGVVAALALGALGWWYLRGPTAPAPSVDDDATAGDDPTPAADPDWSVPSRPPHNSVEAAWRTLRERAGADDAHTPAEVARLAARREFDADAVEEVTALFRQSRYGDGVTADDEARATAARDAFERAGDGGGER